MPANAVETVSAPSNADFKSLEEKILRTIELLKSAREAKAAAERDASRLREKLNEREEEIDTMRQEMVGLRREREEVRTRVEKMLDQIEALNSEESAGESTQQRAGSGLQVSRHASGLSFGNTDLEPGRDGVGVRQ